MAIQKPTKAQVTAAITTVVGILILITTTLPITDMVKLYIGFGIGVIGIIGNVYGVYRTTNGISNKASAAELLTAASALTNVAVARTAAAVLPVVTMPPIALVATPAVPEVSVPAEVPPTVGTTGSPINPIGD